MKSTILISVLAEIHISDIAGTGFFFLLLSAFILFLGLILLIPKVTRKAGKIICLTGLGFLLVGGTMCAVG